MSRKIAKKIATLVAELKRLQTFKKNLSHYTQSLYEKNKGDGWYDYSRPIQVTITECREDIKVCVNKIKYYKKLYKTNQRIKSVK